MAKILDLGGSLPTTTAVLFTGKFEASKHKDSENKPYVWGVLKTPVTVYCSTDKDFPEIPLVDRLLVRIADAESDLWEGDAEKGFFIPKFEADYSFGQKECTYQFSTIRQWLKGVRQSESKEKKTSAYDQIEARNKAKIEEAAKK
jgi:hypothetical protein